MLDLVVLSSAALAAAFPAANFPRPGRISGGRVSRLALAQVSMCDSGPSNSSATNGADGADGWSRLDASFDEGFAVGEGLVARFVSPRIDDPGLPYADALTVLCGALFVASASLGLGLPRPSWLVAMPGIPAWRALPYVPPTLAHGSALALCWLLGALAARAFEADAFAKDLRSAIASTWKAGAFAIGSPPPRRASS